MKLSDQVAIITGAASGLGEAIAMAFAREGANMIIADIQEEKLNNVAKRASGYGRIIVPLKANMLAKEEIKKMVETAIKKFNKIDILVNNAGSPDDYTAVAEMSDQMWDRTLKLLLYAPFYASKEAMRYMLKAKKGNIINISSLAGVTSGRAGVAYTCAKHGLVGLTKNTAFMYADDGIRCNAICPGAVNTPLVENVYNGTTPVSKIAFEKCISGASNMPRVGEPEEISSIAVFLASSDSSFINGSTIVADAGWSSY